MVEARALSSFDIKKISLKVKDDFFKPVKSYVTTVFICGGDINRTDTIRAQISTALKNWMFRGSYSLVFPEDIFDDLLYSPSGKDLLSLENMLADSVDVILIIPESPGSLAELGAFANNSKLLNKIVCVLENKYKKHKSFINQGPVKLIRRANKHGVIYIDIDDLGGEFKRIRAAINRIKNDVKEPVNKITLLQLDSFLLPIIYLLEPVKKDILTECVLAVNENEIDQQQATTVSLATLVKKRLIELTPNGYVLTNLGLKNFLTLTQSGDKVRSSTEIFALDAVRLEILNLKYRNKRLKI